MRKKHKDIRTKQGKHCQTEVRPEESEDETSVLRANLRLVSAGVTKCFVFRAELLHDPNLPTTDPGAFKCAIAARSALHREQSMLERGRC